jgi:GTP cyclohydrolase I
MTQTGGMVVQSNGNGNGNGHTVLQMVDGGSLTPELQKVPSNAVTANTGEDRLQAIIAMLLVELGLDISSQHFRDTPKRVAKFYREFTRGSRVKPAEILKTFRSCHRELIVVSGIQFFSLCPHHLLIYGGKVDFGYIPDGRIVGISKIPRLIQALAARPVVQEDLVAEIADAFTFEVKPLGCAVKITGKHDCVAARGVRCPEATMTTVALRGVFSEEQKFAAEFYQAIGREVSYVR